MRIPKPNLKTTLSVIQFILILILVVMFIRFNLGIAKNAQQAKENTQATKQLVMKQEETIQAIKQLATDNKLTSKQLGDTIICMLQVPISQRTTDVQQACRDGAISLAPSSAAETSKNSVNSGSSSSKSTPPAQPVQHDNVQSSNDSNHPTTLQRIGGAIMNTMRGVTNLVKRIL